MADEQDDADEPVYDASVPPKDVAELHFANRDFRCIGSFKKFKNLQRLWLNGNKLRRIKCLQDNYRLTELYLQDNSIIDITGSLRHLTELQVLLLQGNQLRHLTDVIHELKRLQRLEFLNLFGNPLAQDYDYRNYVIYNIASLRCLDRQEIMKKERDVAQKRYGDECYERLKETLAFGTRVQPTKDSKSHDNELIWRSGVGAEKLSPCAQVGHQDCFNDSHVGDYDIDSTIQRSTPYSKETKTDPIRRKTCHRSLMQYTSFDWSDVPLSKERRLAEDTEQPCIKFVTVHLR